MSTAGRCESVLRNWHDSCTSEQSVYSKLHSWFAERDRTKESFFCSYSLPHQSRRSDSSADMGWVILSFFCQVQHLRYWSASKNRFSCVYWEWVFGVRSQAARCWHFHQKSHIWHVFWEKNFPSHFDILI